MWNALGARQQLKQSGSEDKAIQHYVQSGTFSTIDNMFWKLRFLPGSWPYFNEKGGKEKKTSHSKIILYAIPNPIEKAQKNMKRNVNLEFSVFNIGGSSHILTMSEWKHEAQLDEDNRSFTLEKFW